MNTINDSLVPLSFVVDRSDRSSSSRKENQMIYDTEPIVNLTDIEDKSDQSLSSLAAPTIQRQIIIPVPQKPIASREYQSQITAPTSQHLITAQDPTYSAQVTQHRTGY